MRLHELVLMAGRLNDHSTQLYICVETEYDTFFVPISDYHHIIGYLQFDRFCVKYPDSHAETKCFELSALHPKDLPSPNPQLCLSGVLRSSVAYSSAHQAQTAYRSYLTQQKIVAGEPSELHQSLR